MVIQHWKTLIICIQRGTKNKKRSVLHVGCADYPIYNPQTNLHICLCSSNKYVDGYDIQKDVLENMQTHPLLTDAKLYHELPDKKYDLILAPETIEHVNNVEGILLGLLKCADANTIIVITVPNAFCELHMLRNKVVDGAFIEVVHPDHNCWYSPYTLPNTVRKVYGAHNINVDFCKSVH